MYTTPITKNRFSQDRFPAALKCLMDERQLSYRQLAYKTKLSAGYLNHLTKGTRPVPADPVIAVIAEALRVEPDFFLEYRLRQVADVLDGSPALADKLYGILLRAPAGTGRHRRVAEGAEERQRWQRPRRAGDRRRRLLTRADARYGKLTGRPEGRPSRVRGVLLAASLLRRTRLLRRPLRVERGEEHRRRYGEGQHHPRGVHRVRLVVEQQPDDDRQ